jgi:hypothetical protein
MNKKGPLRTFFMLAKKIVPNFLGFKLLAAVLCVVFPKKAGT